MTDKEAMAGLTKELERINRNLGMLFGIPGIDNSSELALQVQGLIDERKHALKGIAVWPASDATGQTYLCIRRGFMQATSCFPVDDVEAAQAYLSGVTRGR